MSELDREAVTVWRSDSDSVEVTDEVKDGRLVWLDMEMTGLDTANDRILEIAVVVTDDDLQEIAASPALAIHQSENILGSMNQWNTEHHGESGLLERVRSEGITEEQAEVHILQFLHPLVNPNVSPMCGNSICQDRRFLALWMPALEKFFHYRHLDVSTLKELYKRWCPDQPAFDKEYQHLALADVRDSIAELRFYREHFLRR